ncbi:MAG TPA: transcription elongation factor GreA [Ghiorsea sp.]|nr:transcription elongation factor GreA [Ghiorsea sp.]HIP07713.1 transcription elongation factor GreA [Mariprofundaceae bacterium]
MERVPMTQQGADVMRAELAIMKSEKRHGIIAAIEEALAHGDLSENAEYHAAKEEQGMNEARIKLMEDKLARAQIIDPSTIESDRIVFGATVKLVDLDTDKEITYKIVGEDEAKIENGTISITSPIARALIGKEEGDMATVRAPGGDRELEIVEISYQ